MGAAASPRLPCVEAQSGRRPPSAGSCRSRQRVPGNWSRGLADRQPSGTLMTRVPQFRILVVVWLDLGGMYSVASHAESDVPSGTANE